MRLYKIRTHFYGKDLDEEASLGYAVAENDDGIYDHINKKNKYDEWPESVEMTREGGNSPLVEPVWSCSTSSSGRVCIAELVRRSLLVGPCIDPRTPSIFTALSNINRHCSYSVSPSLPPGPEPMS